MPKRKRDNSTYKQKVHLRQRALEILAEMGIPEPVVMETHGGAGKLFNRVYAHLKRGVVFEKDGSKADKLGLQRPTWAVYEGDCIKALQNGVGGHLSIDLLDVDPYGECWPTISAFLSSRRPFADKLVIVVNDGLRQSLSLGKAWAVNSMREMVERFGNDLHPVYLEVCEVMLKQKAAEAGYTMLSRFHGYYCGYSQANTHFLAVLERGQSK